MSWFAAQAHEGLVCRNSLQLFTTAFFVEMAAHYEMTLWEIQDTYHARQGDHPHLPFCLSQGKEKHTNIQKFGGLSWDWVDGNNMLMLCFGGHSLRGRKNINKIPRKSRDNPAIQRIFCLCFFSSVGFRSQLSGRCSTKSQTESSGLTSPSQGAHGKSMEVLQVGCTGHLRLASFEGKQPVWTAAIREGRRRTWSNLLNELRSRSWLPQMPDMLLPSWRLHSAFWQGGKSYFLSFFGGGKWRFEGNQTKKTSGQNRPDCWGHFVLQNWENLNLLPNI